MSEAQQEALKSLQTLGYSADVAQEMIVKTVSIFGENLDAQQLIKQALTLDRPTQAMSFEQHVLAALNRIENKLDGLEDRMDHHFASLAHNVNMIDQRLERLEEKGHELA